MDVTALVVPTAASYAWGLIPNRLERADLTAPIAFVVICLALAGLNLVGGAPGPEALTPPVELTLVWALFCDTARMPVQELRHDAGRHLHVLAVGLPQQRTFGHDRRDPLTQFCRDCDVRFAGYGGCPKDRFAMGSNAESGQHHLRLGYLSFFHRVLEPTGAMVQLPREGRAPSELMAVYSRDDALRGRNEPGTCGSVRTRKNCPRIGAR